MTKFSTRQATIADLDSLAELFDLYRIFYGQESDIDGARQFLFQRFEHRESVIFLVQDLEKNQYVGFTQLYPSFSSVSMQRSWILNDLYLRPEYRGMGLATSLLQSAENYAIQTKAKGISLETAKSNERAQQIYQRSGYVKEEEFVHYYKKV